MEKKPIKDFIGDPIRCQNSMGNDSSRVFSSCLSPVADNMNESVVCKPSAYHSLIIGIFVDTLHYTIEHS